MERMTLSLEEGVIVENAFSPLLLKNDEYEEGHSQCFPFTVPENTRQLTVYLFASEIRFPRFVYQEDRVTLQNGIFPIKRFNITIAAPSTVKRTFTLKLVYQSHGIDLSYNDPDTGEDIQVHVDTEEADSKLDAENEQKECANHSPNESPTRKPRSLGFIRRLFAFVANLTQSDKVFGIPPLFCR